MKKFFGLTVLETISIIHCFCCFGPEVMYHILIEVHGGSKLAICWQNKRTEEERPESHSHLQGHVLKDLKTFL